MLILSLLVTTSDPVALSLLQVKLSCSVVFDSDTQVKNAVSVSLTELEEGIILASGGPSTNKKHQGKAQES